MGKYLECPYYKECVEIYLHDEHDQGTREYECPKCFNYFPVYAESIIRYSVGYIG